MEEPVLADYEEDQVLEVLIKAYQIEARGKAPILPSNPLSAQVYVAAREACEDRMVRAPIPKHLKILGEGEMEPVSLEVIVRCLKPSAYRPSCGPNKAGGRGI